MRSRTWRAVAAMTALAALTAACGDDDDDATTDDTETEDTSDNPALDTGGDDEGATGGGAVEVTAVDYAFEGLPDEIEVGTTVGLTNSSAAEVHEMVAFLIPEAEERSAEELLELTEEELGQAFGGAPAPAFVVVAMPEGEGQVAVPPGGNAQFTSPGRYLVMCAIPVGADPAVYQAALESGSQEPPQVPNAGPPHFTQGMFAEVTVS